MAWTDCGDVTKREKIYGPFNIVFECILILVKKLLFILKLDVVCHGKYC
jgi:hypothetical protein